ncbi:MFS transporter [Xenorhabdus sp. PB30.3]|uniref:MFS transporter n=1 Tax=Xenorhabdus sp. PB30.3 TaxID=2788941 RepID=UPI001E3740A0|nr:MFS transporter [Xenorhabdus sp. PB30.3]MCC8381767.1 MFS transporter [Xenorhabdus sp. PB30.3]
MSTRTLHRYPLLISVLLALTGLTVVGQIYIPIPILTEITQHFNNNKNMAGWVSSAFSIGYSAGFLLSGPLSDRFGRRLVMLTGFIFFLLFTVLVGFCSSFSQLLTLRVLQGFAASCYPPIILAYLNENLSSTLKSRAISFMSLGFLTASIVAQLYAIKFSHYGFNTIELVLVPIYFGSIILIYFVVHRDKENNQVEENHKTTLFDIYRKIPGILFEKNLKWLYLSTLCTLSALVAFYIMMDESYGEKFAIMGIEPFTTRLIVLPVMFLSLLAPWIIQKIGAISLVRWSFLIAAAGLILSSVTVYFGSAWGLLFSSVIFIGGRAFSVPSLVGVIAVLAEQQYRGTAISLYTFVLFVGASIGPLIAHLLLMLNYSISLLVLAFIAGLPALLTLFIREC